MSLRPVSGWVRITGCTASGLLLPAKAATDLFVAAPVNVGGMQRLERGEQALHRVGERVVGRVHARKQRVSSDRGRRGQVQDARHRRLLVAAHVGVPHRALGEGRSRVGVDLHELWSPVHAGRGRVDVQLAEAAPEAHVLLVVDVLIAEEEDEVFEQPAVQDSE